MTNQIMRRLEALEESMAPDDALRPEIRIVFVSPDGSQSKPMTLEEVKQRSEEKNGHAT